MWNCYLRKKGVITMNQFLVRAYIFFLSGVIIFFSSSTQAGQLHSLQNQIEQQQISSSYGIIAGLSAVCGAYHLFSWPIIATKRWIDNDTSVQMRMSAFDVASGWIRKNIAFFLSRKAIGCDWEHSGLCQMIDQFTKIGLQAGALYGLYRLMSVTNDMVRTAANHRKWMPQLVHTLQQRTIMLHVLSAIKAELMQVKQSCENPHIALIALASDIDNKYDQLIKKQTELCNMVFEQACVLASDDDVTALLEGVKQDLHLLAQENILPRAAVIVCIQDNNDCLNAVTEFYQACDVLSKNDSNLWKSARIANASARTILRQIEKLLSKNYTQQQDALVACKRIAWFASKKTHTS